MDPPASTPDVQPISPCFARVKLSACHIHELQRVRGMRMSADLVSSKNCRVINSTKLCRRRSQKGSLNARLASVLEASVTMPHYKDRGPSLQRWLVPCITNTTEDRFSHPAIHLSNDPQDQVTVKVAFLKTNYA